MASAPKKPTLAPVNALKPVDAPVAPATPVPLAPAPQTAIESMTETMQAVMREPAKVVEQVAETMQAALREPAKVVEQMQSVMLEPAKAVEAMAEPMREIQDQIREAAEKGLGETRVVFDRLRAAAEETGAAFEASMKSAAEGVQNFNLKVVEAMRVNAEANFDLLKALVSARSLSEAIALNSEHVRKSFDALSAQSKELGETAQKLAADAFAPLRDGVAKALNKAA